MNAPLPRWVVTVPGLVPVVLLAVMVTTNLPTGAYLALIAAQALCVAQAVALWRHDRQPTRPDTGPYSEVPTR